MKVLRTTRAAPPTSRGARALSPRLPGEGCAGLGTFEAREVLGGEPDRRVQGPLEGRELRAPPRARGPEALGGPWGFRPDRGLSAGFAPSPPGSHCAPRSWPEAGAARARQAGGGGEPGARE